MIARPIAPLHASPNRPPARRTHRPRRAPAIALALAASLGIPGLPHAPPPPPPPGNPAQAAAELNDYTARLLARLALVDLRLQRVPQARDFRITAELLLQVHGKIPQDETVLRLALDAFENAGDADMVTELTRRVVRLDPQDTVAQLRLISGSISALQQAEERVAAYERILDADQAGRLDPALRSRLALDLALLLREQGDIDGFTRRLRQAIALDQSNKDAASLLVTFASPMAAAGRERVELLLTLLLADPYDPTTHLAIARELAASGAVAGATRFYQMVNALLGQNEGNENSSLFAEQAIISWVTQGPQRVIFDLTNMIEVPRRNLIQQRQQAQAMGRSLEGAAEPGDIRLSIDLERVRLIAAAAIGDQAMVDRSLGELVESIARQARQLEDPAFRPPGATEALVQQELRRRDLDAVWLSLWVGRNPEIGERAVADLSANPDADPRAVARLRGWLHLRQNRLNEAEATLTPLAADDPLAELGLAVLEELRGSNERAIERYISLSRRVGGTLAGAYARTRATVLMGDDLPQTQEQRDLEQFALSVAPQWLEEMIAFPRKQVLLQANLDRQTMGQLDPIFMTVRLRNTSPIPLAIGPEAPLSSRLFLIPDTQLAVDSVQRQEWREVFSLERRLRLNPQEEMVVRLWPDPGMFGWVVEKYAGTPVRIRWRLILGAVLSKGLVDVGRWGMSTESAALLRTPLPTVQEEVSRLVERIETDPVTSLPEVLVAVRWRLLQPASASDAFSDEEGRLVMDALVRRYPTLDVTGRLLMMAIMPTAGQKPAFAPLDAVMLESEPDPLAGMVLAMTRLTDPKDPRFDQWSSTGNPRIDQTVAMVRDRLASGVRTYARLTARPEGPQQQPAPDPFAQPQEEEAPDPTPGLDLPTR